VSVESDQSGEGEIPKWKELIASAASGGFGWEMTRDGFPRLLLRQPASFDKGFLELSSQTLKRRSGMAPKDDAGVLRVGPGLSGIAYRRKGGWLWIGVRGEDLADCPEPVASNDVVRWGFLDITDVSLEKEAWRRAEGAFSPDYTRPFSDRILGLLGWAPSLQTITSERKRSADRFSERVTFTLAAEKPATRPPAPKAQGPAKKKT
jgi:hypothetical protein